MKKRLPVRRSGLARWSRRVGAVGVPLILVAVGAHRIGAIDPEAMGWSLLLAVVLGALAVLFAFVASVMLWRRGGAGASDALRGFVYGTLALGPAIAAAVALVLYPPLNDVSTDLDDPPALSGPVRPAAAAAGDRRALQAEAYPDIVPRRFRMEPGQLHAAVRKVVDKRGWAVAFELPPDMPDAGTRLQVVVRTPVLALTDDVAIRIRPDRFGALLDIRSASRLGSHDLGANATRIRTFFRDLDEALLESYGDLARLTVTEEEVAEAAARPVEELPLLTERPLGSDDGRVPLPTVKPFLGGEFGDDMPAELEEIFQDDAPDLEG
ncbi:DUF1499 domain-containing protein [Polymorphum gilvum]|uniref:DUF1499 domain-containing protein n=1 Tax=Polymorphum gilvum (strain LMG 25793 / CGMCC 1.9160 / SL003B-26A1) TaxID=991905 RepID=F2IY94_POLGS|nr:DUF1499 domain-containing protein [Polymorphum gilvum]ADZ71706.1 hypothetical protein SL003B_3284 [Polymorphum gilvum SL003B-26A1]